MLMHKFYKNSTSTKTHLPAPILISLILSSNIFATTNDITGISTSKNGVSLGRNAITTAINGVSAGNNAVATGNGFTRKQFESKRQENKNAIEVLEAKKLALTNAQLDISSISTAISEIDERITYLTEQQKTIKTKIDKKNKLDIDKQNKEAILDNQINIFNEAKVALDKIKINDLNKFINFTDVLRTLQWTKLNGTNEKRDELANDLKKYY